MKILYFYQYFSTPNGSWGTRVYEFAKEWVAQGHEVTVVTSVYSKSDIRAIKRIEDQYYDGIHAKILNIKIDNKQSLFRRVWSFLQYGILSSYYAVKLPADIVVASSGPITIGLPGLAAKYLRNRKLVFETRDLWPEGAIELGVIRNTIVKKLAFRFERMCYEASSFIITLSPGMSDNIKRRFGYINVTDVTNAANIALFSGKRELKDTNLKVKNYAIYTGNIGEVNNSYWLFKAAKKLKELGREDIKIVLIGEGQQREELEKLAEREQVANFIRLGLMPKSELVAYVQNAFVSLVPLKGTPVLDTSSPNKFFESLAAGVPVIQNTQGWLKDFLNEHEVGFTLDPNNPVQLAKTLIRMKDETLLSERMGQRGAEIAKAYFDKNHLANKMLTVLENVYREG